MMKEFSPELESALATHRVTGASFAYWDGARLHTAVAGLRNSVTRDPITADTVMHIGSIAKVLNAVLLMQLVDEGTITLEDSVIQHLPELCLRDTEARGRITCGMLLNHTSGIDGDWLPECGPDQERIVDAISRCAELGQLFAPGAATSYCNIATVIAGYLVQKLRGKSWYNLVRNSIYRPLGLQHALADIIDTPRFRCSVGDLTDPATGDMVQTTRPFLSPSFAPAGSTLMMSATDLVTFARTLCNGGMGENGARILSATSATRMTEPCGTLAAPAYQVGLGWMIAPGGVLTHTGVGPGVYSMLFADSRSDRAVALLTNCDRGSVLRPKIVDPILESWTEISLPNVQRRGDTVDPRPYEGMYENNLQRTEVFVRDAGLAMRVTLKMKLYDNSPYGRSASERSPSILYPLGNDVFEADPLLPHGPKAELKFVQPDAAGRMRYLGMGYRLLVRTQ